MAPLYYGRLIRNILSQRPSVFVWTWFGQRNLAVRHWRMRCTYLRSISSVSNLMVTVSVTIVICARINQGGQNGPLVLNCNPQKILCPLSDNKCHNRYRNTDNQHFNRMSPESMPIYTTYPPVAQEYDNYCNYKRRCHCRAHIGGHKKWHN